MNRTEVGRVLAGIWKLPIEERQVLGMRYGFTGKIHSLTEVAVSLGLSRERVREIEREAIGELLKGAQDG